MEESESNASESISYKSLISILGNWDKLSCKELALRNFILMMNNVFAQISTDFPPYLYSILQHDGISTQIILIKRILQKAGEEAAAKVLHLIKLENELTSSNLTNGKLIVNNFSLIKTFLLLFGQADKFKRNGKIEEECTIYLYLAVYFDGEDDPSWSWLSTEFYKIAITTCAGYRLDKGLTEATVRYLYGRVCFLKLQLIDEAIKHLSIASKLSEGKSWIASGFTGVQDDYIFAGARRLLYLAHIGMISIEKKTNPEEVLFHLQEAAILSTTKEELGELLIPLADAYYNVNNHKETIKNLRKFLQFVQSYPNLLKEISLSNLDISFFIELRFFYYYVSANNEYLALDHLFNLYEIAKAQQDDQNEALVYKYHGLFYLRRKEFQFAKCMLLQAYRMYLILGDLDEAEQLMDIINTHVNKSKKTQFPTEKEKLLCDPFALRDIYLKYDTKLNKHERLILHVINVERPNAIRKMRKLRKTLKF